MEHTWERSVSRSKCKPDRFRLQRKGSEAVQRWHGWPLLFSRQAD